MRFREIYWKATIVAILVIGLIVWYCLYSPFASQDEAIKYAQAQLYFSVVVIIGIIFSLLYATAQFRKSLARPNLKLTFDEEDVTKIFLNVEQKEFVIPIYAYNKGDKVASTYQIQLEIPSIFEKYLIRESEGDRLPGKPSGGATTFGSADTFVVTFYSYNKPEYTCYIDKYIPIGKIRLRAREGFYIKSKTLELDYKIFGDWGEHQKGSLQIIFGG